MTPYLITEDKQVRNKLSFDIFWLKDENLEDLNNFPEPDALTRDITANLESALEQFRNVCEDLGEK